MEAFHSFLITGIDHGLRTSAMDKHYIISEIKRVAAQNGSPPGKLKFYSETGIAEGDWAGKYWLRWSDALRDAGFAPNKWQQPHDTRFLIESYVRLIRELGHFPLARELMLKRRFDRTFPNTKSFRRLGAQPELASGVIAYCEAQGDYHDVIEICKPIASRQSSNKQTSGAETPFGFVYLLRSGRHYKIGRTNAAGRRERELSIQLPEAAKNVHTIRTDDPAGIEAYWHQRFARKRRGGEWFDLDASDVAAFRRRKFM